MGAEATRLQSELVLEVHEGEAPADWNEWLLRAGGSAFHSVDWARHKAHGGAGDALFCSWRSEPAGEDIARAVAIRRPPRRSRIGRIASKVIFDSPPATQAAGQDFVTPLALWAKGQRALLEVDLGSLDARCAWVPGETPGRQRRREYLLPTGPDWDLWKGMSRASHRNIKRARKTDMETRVGGGTDLGQFVRIYRSTLERLKGVKDLGFRLDDDSFRDSLEPLFEQGGRGHLYLAGRDGATEAGWLFIALGDRACAVYSGMTEEARACGGNTLSLYDAVCDLQQRGIVEVNLGGASWHAIDPDSPDHGLHVYKTRFGGEPQEREGGVLALRPLRARLIDSVRRVVGR